MARVRAALMAGCCCAAVAGCGGGSSPTPQPTATASSSSSSSSAGAQSAAGTARVVINPDHGTVGTTLHVTGSGYGAGILLTGTLCAVDAKGVVTDPFSDCDLVDLVTVTTDAQGGFTTDYTVKKIPPAKAGYQIGFGRQGDASQSAGAAFTVDG